MCGRYVSASTPDEIATYFDAEVPAGLVLERSWNVAPTDDIYVVRAEDGHRTLAAHHWGLVPFWAKSPKQGARMINARGEGVASQGAFKHAFAHRRCLVPADGFYEWRAIPGQKAKQPYFIHRPDGEPLAFAGLWERWRPTDGDRNDVLRSATIITTTPNGPISALHDRMPVILPASRWDEWLDVDGDADLEALQALLVPAPDDLLVLEPVSTEVNSVRNDGPQLIAPVEPPPIPQTLDV